MFDKTLLSFETEQARRGAYARRDGGMQTVAVERIVGSVGRAGELDRRFRRRRGWYASPYGAETRLRRVRQLFLDGRVPPLELYRIGEDLFVVDGHHRTQVALERGQDFLEAHVVEHLPDRSDPANRVYYERASFVAATGLKDVNAAEPGRYPKLLNRVRDHRHAMLQERRPSPRLLGYTVPAPDGPNLHEAARDWYECEYLPVVEVLTAERLPERFAGCAPGDLYGYVCDHRWYMSERAGWDVGIDSALVDFVHRNAPDALADSVIDPIVALGSEALERSLRSWSAHAWASLVAGIVTLPIAFARGLRPEHYRFPRIAG